MTNENRPVPTFGQVDAFDPTLSIKELRYLFEDPSHDESVREHAFFRYWHRWLRGMEGSEVLARDDVLEMLKYSRWTYPIGDLINGLCRANRIRTEDIDWLLDILPEGSFARDQILALQMLNSPLEWDKALLRAFELQANWAAYRVILRVPLDETDKARQIIATHKRPKWLLAPLHEREKAARQEARLKKK